MLYAYCEKVYRNGGLIPKLKGGMTYVSSSKGNCTRNTVVIEDEDIRDYDGTEVIVTLLNYPQRKVKKHPSTGIVLLSQAKEDGM